MFGRIALFILTNVFIVVTISILTSVFGLNNYMTQQGLDYQALLIFCLVWGMTGSLISLLISRWSAKMAMGVTVIDPMNAGQFADYVQMVHNIAKSAGLPKMPEVGVFQSPELNAFATGPTKSRALVACSTGLLQSMSRDQIEGVVAHEVAHIKNGDMVTMCLIQGVVNAFVMFFARVIAFAVSQQVKEENRYMIRFLITFVLEILIGFLGLMVVAWFSRKREFRADAGSAALVGRGDMISALQALQRRYEIADPTKQVASMNPFKIATPGKKRGMSLFATHPPLEDRIAALEQYA